METKPLTVGTVLKERYTITRLVAGGGMAWVYEARETLPDSSTRAWAMKELRADAEDTHSLDEGKALFRQEANLLVGLNHPNLPRVNAFFEQNGRSYLVMEFIHGESLEKRLRQANAPLLEMQVLDWAVQICEVLHYLHTRPHPIIFRDLKPSNVMITLGGRVKLIDFGIARTYKVGKRKDTLTMGSENYAAPEQWGKAQTDARADVYGLGATMYHLLTNVPPLPTFVPATRVPILQYYNPAVSSRTVAAVERAMEMDRERRFGSAREMQAELLACLPRAERRRVEAQLRRSETADALSVAPGPAIPLSEPRPQATASHPPIAPPPSPVAVPAIYTKPCPRCNTLNRPASRFCRRCAYPFVPPLPPTLSLVQPTAAHWEYPLRDSTVLIGRRGGALPVDLDVEFYDPEGYVSRNHCHITVDQRRYHLSDLASSNGTYVNDERLTPHVPRLLRDGDRIRIGRIVMRFCIR